MFGMLWKVRNSTNRWDFGSLIIRRCILKNKRKSPPPNNDSYRHPKQEIKESFCLGTDGHRQWWRVVLKFLEHLGDEIDIYQKTWNRNVVIWAEFGKRQLWNIGKGGWGSKELKMNSGGGEKQWPLTLIETKRAIIIILEAQWKSLKNLEYFWMILTSQ